MAAASDWFKIKSTNETNPQISLGWSIDLLWLSASPLFLAAQKTIVSRNLNIAEWRCCH
jgi:hypothetical protein